MFSKTPNLIFFDHHDDACTPNISVSELLRKWGVDGIEDVSSRDFWSFVEFNLSGIDDDWLLAGMELNLINHAVVIGAENPHNIRDLSNQYKSSDGKLHELYDIDHIDLSIGNRGCLGDSMTEWPYKNIRNIFEYHQYEHDYVFSSKVNNPFVLDFDLDCFTTECENYTYAWPETIFYEKYAISNVINFMKKLIDRSTFITICREPSCCGGIGESNKILSYLDRYFFEGKLGAFSIR